jgi:hypothetical protein
LIACLYGTVALLIFVYGVCEMLGSAIHNDSLEQDRDYLWGQYEFSLEEINYPVRN